MVTTIVVAGKDVLLDTQEYQRLLPIIGELFINRNGYCYVSTVERKLKALHKFILPNELMVDHINGNKLDNQKKNLRPVDMSKNVANRDKRKSTACKYKGVTKNTGCDTFTARCKKEYLGSFKTQEDTAKAYNEAAIKTFKEFARLNKIQ